MHPSWPGQAQLLFPFVASVLYVLAVLCAKRATELGSGAWRPTLAANLASGILFAPLLLLGGQMPAAALLWQPLLVGVLFLGGQAATFYALREGDVTVATPVLGLKIPFVAGLSVALGVQPVTGGLWLAAGLATAAVAMLTGGPAQRGRVGRAIAGAAGAAAAFALFDVLVARWSPAWGTGRFLPVMMGCVALLSLALQPLLGEPLRATPRPCRRWLVAGAALMAVQAVCLVSAIAWFGQAVPMNIVYSARSLWSQVAVWAIGHWFHSAEQKLGPNVLRWRLAGALTMMAAVILVLRARP